MNDCIVVSHTNMNDCIVASHKNMNDYIVSVIRTRMTVLL